MNVKFAILLRVVVICGLLFSQGAIQPRAVTAARLLSTSALHGRVTDGEGNGVDGVTISATAEFWMLFFPLVPGSGTGNTSSTAGVSKAPATNPTYTALTNANGEYTFPVLIDGRYTLTATKGDIVFKPASRPVTLPDATSQDFQVDTPPPVIPNQTRILTGVSNQYLESISADGAIFTFSQTTTELAPVITGDIIVSAPAGAAPYGYLREVISVANPAGRVVLTTEPALLEEAVEDGSIYFQHAFTPAQAAGMAALPGVRLRSPLPAASGPFSFVLDQVVLYDADGNPSTIADQVRANGSIDFRLETEFYLNIQDHQLLSLSATQRSDWSDSLEIVSGTDLETLQWEQVLGSITFAPLTQTIGQAPVVFAPRLVVSLNADGSLKAGMSSGVSRTLTVQAGVDYSATGGWQADGHLSSQYTFETPHPILEAGVEAASKMQFSLDLYDIAGPYLTLSPYSAFRVNPAQTPWWVLSAGEDAPYGYKMRTAYRQAGEDYILDLADFAPASIHTQQVLAQALADNHAPHLPSNPSPAHAAIGVNGSPTLTWSGGDPDGDAVLYDLVLEAGDNSPDVLVAGGLTPTSFTPGELESETTYFWQISAVDPYGWRTSGPVWQFTTRDLTNQPPRLPANPSPAHGGTGISLSPVISWTGGDPDGDNVSYDVFFEAGDSSPDVLVSNDQTAASYAPGTLAYNTTYYWQITASDPHSLTTTGPVWSFTTANQAILPTVDVKIGGLDHPRTYNNLDTFAVTWSSAHADSCSGSGAMAGFSGLSGSIPSGPLENGQYVFRMTCTSAAGARSDEVSVTVSDLLASQYLTAGGSHTCALTAAGGVACWGLNDSGQLGDGSISAMETTPVDVSGLSTGVREIDAGELHTCALTESGGIQCWGNNQNGELGNDSENSSSVPVNVFGLSTGAQAVSAGYSHTCALTQSGGVKCWGGNLDGELGDGSTFSSSVPVDVIGLSTGVQAVSAGYFHSCALVNAGVRCWGWNDYGQLGNNSEQSSPEPVTVVGLSSGVRAIAAGGNHTCALLEIGSVRCWGLNETGQLGDSSTTWSSVPVAVSGLTGVRAVTAGGYHTCALTEGRSVFCWGFNEDGELGNNSTTNRSVPTAVSGLSGGIRAVAAGGYHTCAATQAGGVLCWGLNETGQLGDNSTTRRLTPVAVVGWP